MVEENIKKYDGKYTKKQLWMKLPKQVMYQTYSVIIDYLIYSRKISVDKKGKLGWIYYPKLAEYYYVRKNLSRRR